MLLKYRIENIAATTAAAAAQAANQYSRAFRSFDKLSLVFGKWTFYVLFTFLA